MKTTLPLSASAAEQAAVDDRRRAASPSRGDSRQVLPRRRFLGWAMGGAALAAGLAPRGMVRGETTAEAGQAGGGKLVETVRRWQYFGTEIKAVVLHDDEEQADQALEAAGKQLLAVDLALSLYRPQSDLARLNAAGEVRRPRHPLVAVLSAARRMAQRTGGAFDVSVQPLWLAYAEAQREGRRPTDAEIDAARALVDWRQLEVAPERVRFLRPGMSATLNGIAQGYALDRIRAAFTRHGIRHALIDTGELGAVGAKPDATPWNVGIQHPRADDAYVALAGLADRCLATSGDYATRFADPRDHHLFDPRTGRSAAECASVSVAAASGTEADALSTAVFVLGVERGLRLIQKTPGADALIVCRDGRLVRTGGFPQLPHPAS